MKVKNLLSLVMTTSLALFGKISYSEPLSVLGLTTGMSLSQAQSTVKSMECRETKGSELGDARCHIFWSSNTPIEYGGFPAKYLMASFYDDKLSWVTIRFLEAAFQPITEALITKFGEPSEKTDGVIQNRMGASFKSAELKWSVGEDKLHAVQRSGKIDESQVRLISNDAAAEFERRSKAKTKDAAGKL